MSPRTPAKQGSASLPTPLGAETASAQNPTAISTSRPTPGQQGWPAALRKGSREGPRLFRRITNPSVVPPCPK